MARLLARLLLDDDQPHWHSLWSRSGSALALHWKYTEMAALKVGTPRHVGIFTEAGQLVAAVPFVERRVHLRACWRHPAPAHFAGLLYDPRETSESFLRDAFAALAEFVCEAIRSAELILSPAVSDGRGLAWHNWALRPHYNYTSSITHLSSLADQCENAVRRQARKAEEAGCEVLEGGEHLPAILALWEETRQRQKIVSWVHQEAFIGLVEWLEKEPELAVKVLLVRDADHKTALAGGIFAADPARVHYLLGASQINEQGPGSGAPSLMHFRVTESFFRERGAFTYDWVGANTPSIAQFKKKFRPQLELSLRASWQRKWSL